MKREISLEKQSMQSLQLVDLLFFLLRFSADHYKSPSLNRTVEYWLLQSLIRAYPFIAIINSLLITEYLIHLSIYYFIRIIV